MEFCIQRAICMVCLKHHAYEVQADGAKYFERWGERDTYMPPYVLRRTNLGEVVLSERTFNMLSRAYGAAGNMVSHVTANAMKLLIGELDEHTRNRLLAPELHLARNPNDPRRTQGLQKGEDETDEAFAFRVAKRAYALEMIPPNNDSHMEPDTTSDSDPGDLVGEPGAAGGGEAEPLTGTENEGGQSEETPLEEDDPSAVPGTSRRESRELSSNTSETTSEEEEQWTIPRPPRRFGLVLSGTPYARGETPEPDTNEQIPESSESESEEEGLDRRGENWTE
jgi:hypothetical protein